MASARTSWLANWRQRHQSRVCWWLHLIGIPLTLLAVALGLYQLCLWRWDLWWRPAALLAAGYLLQFLGHLYEGNDMGEVVLVKRWRGRPYVAVSPRYQKP